MNIHWLEIKPSELSQEDAQERMYILTDEYDKLVEQIKPLNNLLNRIFDEKVSLLKAYPVLKFRREKLNGPPNKR